MWNGQLGVIILDCKNLLSAFPNFSVNFVRRQTNGITHSLAKVVTSYASSYIHHTIPYCIQSTIMNENS
ncbi:hypothetical protein GLYMA_14G110400v4 [Glycine max]|uniref:RNase H type-1 domain-containing protein n=1 Tax=Glycine max TaxID=3847 RepID=A0A0R0GCC5_SOYBN|nr:hypothetical protein GYH30_039685 [Glycine max]KRH15776.1 hypothetical protein GLYMA_14G110400v4 [Glycine max]